MKEHDRVIFVKAFTEGNITIPVGTVGCIVHVYGNGEAFEVEVITEEGESQVCTVEPVSLMHIKTREVWDAIRETVKSIKSGEITPEQIREVIDKQEWVEIDKAVSKRRQHRIRW